MKVNPHRSSLGMDANIMALVCIWQHIYYGWIPCILYVAFIAPFVITSLKKRVRLLSSLLLQAFILKAVNFVFLLYFG
jgi:hypothetical protein